MPDVVGWISSAILLVTIVQQIRTQVRERSSRGVSVWLFVGEIASASGFLLYSIMLGLIVYIVTNSIMIVSSAAGLAITIHQRRGNT